MSLLERVIAAHKCRSMHHHIALDALSLIEGESGEDWKNLFLRLNAGLFEGAKAPDSRFKDFQNHVLHVSEGQWGGARGAATEWYAKSVEALKAKDWEDAAFSLGVMSHYYADVCQPFHTGQTEEEGAMHRAVEWSIVKSIDTLASRVIAKGYPVIERPEGVGFVSDMVLAAAEFSNPYYDVFIDHYDLDAGVEDPPSGLDETMLDAVADCFAYATAGLGALMSAAIEEAGVKAPKTNLTVRGYLAYANIPLRQIEKRLADGADRKTVARMYKEFQKTGKVIKTLPADDKAIRRLHARMVLRKPLKELDAQELRPLGSKHVPLVPRSKLEDVDVVEDVTQADEAIEIDAAAEIEETAKAKPKRKKWTQVVSKAAKAKTARDAAAQDDPAIAEETEAHAPDAVDELEDAETSSDEDMISATEAALLEEEIDGMSEEDIAELAAIDLDAAPDEDMDAAADAEAAMASEAAETARTRSDRLTLESPIVDAPSIGRKTAKRLSKAGIQVIEDLLDCDVDWVADKLKARHITSEALIDWQDQTMLMMEVPSLRVHDVQVLVGSGIRSAEALAAASATDVFQAAMAFLDTHEGGRVSRFEDDPLAEDEVEGWIDLARLEAA